jgi:hypothetical protein
VIVETTVKNGTHVINGFTVAIDITATTGPFETNSPVVPAKTAKFPPFTRLKNLAEGPSGDFDQRFPVAVKLSNSITTEQANAAQLATIAPSFAATKK